MILRIVGIVLIVSQSIYGDVYLQNPRGSNNRLDGQGRENRNPMRMFNSQNNRRGGYNVGNLYYYAESMLSIEWTNSNSCGEQNADCQLILQYMCDDDLRDGSSQKTIPERNYECSDNNCNKDIEYGMHETMDYWKQCNVRERNKGLFTGDQKLHGNGARYTRQNPNGQRYGYECPEEKDYYPYWGPTPWKDVAIMMNDVTKCGDLVSESQNVKEKFSCVAPPEYVDHVYYRKHGWWHMKNLPLNKEDCEKIEFPEASGKFAKWTETQPWGLPAPLCLQAPRSRDNHNGNGIGGFPNTFNWTIPNFPHQRCALRMRYNVTAAEIPKEADASLNGNDPLWPYDFRWNSAGWVHHFDCLQIYEHKAGRFTWWDNYFCWNRNKKNPGLKWSQSGPIAGMRCTHITEPDGIQYGWDDNYLCVPNDSPLQLTWSSTGPIAGKKCIQWLETADPNGWDNNYLCSEQKDIKIEVGSMEQGFCVTSTGHDQNSGVHRINNQNMNTTALKEDCLKKCLAYGFATGCEVIWDQGNRGCYVHTQDVARGNNVRRHNCWVFSNNLSGSKIDVASAFNMADDEGRDRGYIFKFKPSVAPLSDDNLPANASGKLRLSLAMGPVHYGRVFQDRSHRFEIRERPASLQGVTIHNINVKGKRGNIVQTYPATEYDFVPNRVEAKVGDYVHFQWTGSNTNPNNNAGQGARGTDRSNVVLLAAQNYAEGIEGAAGPINEKFGHWGNSYPEHLNHTTLLGLPREDLELLATLMPPQYGGEMSELDDAGTYFDLPPRQITKKGTYYYMCSRNNNFTNRSQKGKIVVKDK